MDPFERNDSMTFFLLLLFCSLYFKFEIYLPNSQQLPIFNSKFVTERSRVLADRRTNIGAVLCFKVLPRNRTLCEGAKGGAGGEGKRNPKVKR